ncbi:MAG: extracellular solute-binding protein [Lachnospiraceae bacterium]|jgi:raffinose/stachyose/melibiose transport system substrate-binding protein|nr:extracellular solute-binding protein [Lachnospiraceae bacterium]
MKKKILSIALCLTMTAGILAGCGAKKDSDSGDKKTLTMWSIATEADNMHSSYLKAIEEYEKAHPDYKIKFETFENQAYKTKIKSAVAANELPDIFFTFGGGFSEPFAKSGKVVELDKYYEKYKDLLPEAALKNQTYDGKLYGSTFTTPVSMMFYNKAIFKKNNIEVPKTYDELLNAVKVLKKAGITPISTSVKDTWVLGMLHDGLTLKSAGPTKLQNALLKKDGQSYNDPDMLQSAKDVVELKKAGAFEDGATGLSNDEAVQPFLDGKAAMFFTGSWLGGDVNNKSYNKDDFGVAPIPVVNDKNATLGDFMGGASDTLMVAKSSKNKEVACEAAFEIAKNISKNAYLEGVAIPAWKIDYDDSKVAGMTKEIAGYTTKAHSFTLWFDTLLQAEDANKYLELLEQLYTGGITPEQYVKAMADQLDSTK